MWPALADEAVVLGDESWTFADLLLLGIATGLFEEAASSTRRGLAALEQGRAVPAQAVRAEAVAFRRARKLESGQDLRAWLAARELTMEDWESHLQRSLAAGEVPDKVSSAAPSSVAAPAPSDRTCDETERRAIAVDLACWGSWQQFADVAARQWMAARLVGEDFEVAEADITAEATRVMASFEALADFGASWCATRLRSIRTRERSLEVAAQRCATTEAIEARVLEHANDWTEVSFDELLLNSREAANEALLCAREDGLDAAGLAARVGTPLLQHFERHDSLSVGRATLLDGAVPDQPVGPVAGDGQWSVLWLRERRRPSLEDEAARETAAAELLDEALDRVGLGRIRESDVL
jgi:hypothetical protein